MSDTMNDTAPATKVPETEQPCEQQGGTEQSAPEAQATEQEVQAAPPEESQAPDEPEKAAGKEKKPFGKKNRELEAAEAKLAAAAQKQDELKEQLMRTAAEYENFRKRSGREADQKFNDGISYAVSQIIPILDTLEMAANAPCTDENFKKGVTMTLDKAAKALETLKITEIEADGKPFDPNLMNAVSQVPAPEGVESGSVVTVYQKGYCIGDKIIRHATVVVAE